MTRDKTLRALAVMCDELGDLEIDCLLWQANRMRKGQDKYGKLELPTERNLLMELAEEMADANSYWSMFALQMAKKLKDS